MLRGAGKWVVRGLCLWVSLSGQPGRGAVLSIGHRGNSLLAPENTVAAFAAARGVADLVETDGRVSADGRLVVMHDATVDRTTDGMGTVASKTAAQLKLLDAGSWFSTSFTGERVPMLEEMITNTVPFAVPLIEQKDGAASAYVEELRRLGVVTNVILQSFDWAFLGAVHALEPGIQLGALGSGALTTATLNSIMACGASIVAWEKSTVSSNEVAVVHSAGLALYVWTVDGPEITKFIQLGVDGIISNDPGLVRQLQQTSTNAPAMLAEGLIAYWRMDDGVADPFASAVGDSCGANDGILVRNDGASHWFEAPIAELGACLKMEGTNAFVTIPHTSSLDINTNEVTFCAWVRLSTLPSQLGTSYGAIYDSTTDCYVLYLDRANKELRFKVTDATGHAARPGIPEPMLRTNVWLHIAGTYSGAIGPVSGQATIYLNGTPADVHSGNDATAPVGLTGNVKPGQAAAMGREGPTGGNYFTGFVDDVAIWKRALTPAEVAAVYKAGVSGLSLGELLRAPTSRIQPLSIRVEPANQIRIQFTNSGPWTVFRLLRSTTLEGPFVTVPQLTPVKLGPALYEFVYRLSTDASEFFRIEGS